MTFQLAAEKPTPKQSHGRKERVDMERGEREELHRRACLSFPNLTIMSYTIFLQLLKKKKSKNKAL